MNGAATSRSGRGARIRSRLTGFAAAAMTLAGIVAGPSTVESAPAADRAKDWWSFQPIRPVAPPAARSVGEVRSPIDAFILATLEEHRITPGPAADRHTLLRRATLDLTGLPPTPAEIGAFLADAAPDAFAKVVERLLASPRHGERWAQQWLDVVRYADTDGFEVNTERPNAWPYRDYVVRAFNSDKPYDRFVGEQLAGDVSGEDAATGFLVAAAVLLPGQIGADDVSKRLARQDALSEIVGCTGQTFLALSVGCARCHDHKFDPIPQRDYYTMQAFFAGVAYGDRPVRTTETEARLREAAALRPGLARIDDALARFEPVAQVLTGRRAAPDARTNVVSFPPVEARFVRFTIHDTGLHPTLGLIEPCIDELEIFTDEAVPRNIALAGLGTKATASGSRTSGSHRLEHLNDGRYGNAKSWMSDEPGRGWVLFELPAAARIGKVVWSRDREGAFTDRTPTAHTLEAGPTPGTMTRLAHVPPPRAAVVPGRNTDRFAPVSARRLRFTIEECTSLEPCLDELEVFTAGPSPRNVALASAGTTASASGTLPGSERHTLAHLNDGRFGNEHSWISATQGKGSVELTFARPEVIDRVVWGRDREGKFTDRLPTRYRIEVADDAGVWRKVAGNEDRRPFSPTAKPPALVSIAGLAPDEAKEAAGLIDERRRLDARITELSKVPMVYAGVFSEPETTRVLHRGDPEQPKDLVAPTVLSALGTLSMPADSTDPRRRLALGDWITGPAAPLTARVMVNRIWQGHFGVGLVETASDFGTMGARPTHPDLLEWLAGEFVRSGWSMKHLHRLILGSATYARSGRIDRDALAKDGDSRLLWRFPSRRLEAETLRDSMLAVSGRLDLKAGGRGFDLFRSRGGLDGFPPVESFGPEGLRRMVYAHKVRMERESVFGAFDCPDAGQTTARRRQSTTPIQALNLFNSRFTLDEAKAFAARIETEARPGADPAAKARLAYQLAFGRVPGPDELASAVPLVAEHGVATLCRVLFNSSEFLFLP